MHAETLKSAKPYTHPWEDALNALSGFSFPAFVLQIKNESQLHDKLFEVLQVINDNSKMLTIASAVIDILGEVSVVEATPALAAMLEVDKAENVTSFILEQIDRISVLQGFNFLSELMLGPLNKETPAFHDPKKGRVYFTVVYRAIEGENLMILLTARSKLSVSWESSQAHRIRSAMDTISESVALITQNDQIDFMNHSMLNACGRRDIHTGAMIGQVLTAESLNLFSEIKMASFPSTGPWIGDLEFINAQGETNNTLHCEVHTIPDAKNVRAAGYCLIGSAKKAS